MQTVASSILDQLSPLVIDVETSIINKGHPFDPRNRLVSYAFLYNDVNTFCYFTDPDFVLRIRSAIAQAVPCTLVGFNIKFDIHWLNRDSLVDLSNVKIWDCQLAEHILTGQQSPYLSLNEALESYGLPVKLDAVKEYWEAGIDTADIPVHILEEYNKWDVLQTYELYKMQRSIMSPEQVNLLLTEGEDMKTLMAAERAGLKWDKDKATDVKDTLKKSLVDINASLHCFLPDGFGGQFEFNWDSGDQLSALLYGGSITYDYSVSEDTLYKSGPKKGEPYTRNRWFEQTIVFPKRFLPIKGTEVKKTREDPNALVRFYQVDDPTLQQLKTRKAEDKQIIVLLRQRSEKTKIVEMIESIEQLMITKNWQDDIIHGQYNQNVAVTGRLSSSAPNMQNTPIQIDTLLISRYD